MTSVRWRPDGPNLVVRGDNRSVVPFLPDGAFKLIYVDPPFNTGRTQRRQALKTARSSEGGRLGFKGQTYRVLKGTVSSYDDAFADYWAFLEPLLEHAFRLLTEDGTLYLHLDYREAHYAKVLLDALFGRDRFLNEIIWAYDYGARSTRRWPTKHDTILVYVKNPDAYDFDAEAVDREPYMAPGLVTPEKAARGKLPTDVWWHTIVSPTGKEKTGYPTQKPEGVLRRIVQASSRPNDWVLDFFAGSGTLGAVAQRLGRRFVLVDSSPEAMAVMRRRLGDGDPGAAVTYLDDHDREGRDPDGPGATSPSGEESGSIDGGGRHPERPAPDGGDCAMATDASAQTDLAAETHARALDAADPLAPFRDRFHLPPDRVYLDGNSLGLLSRDAERETLAALEQWKTLAIGGWMEADPPWFSQGEELGALTAPLVGAEPASVVVTGGTTVNLHALVATFYRPAGRRRKIVATALDFPSDVYALAAQIRLHGGDPAADLLLVPSRDGRTIDEADIVAALTDDVALALLPSVLYRSGQLLDLPRLAAAARERGVSLGVDCAHSIGAVPHRFDEWGVDWAFWCSYKYLNAGPGAIGGLYVNRRHWGTAPALAGWWGYDKARQFDMVFDWQGAEGAGAWQIGTPSLLAAAPLRGSLRLFAEAGLAPLREKSLAQTAYLIDLLEADGLLAPPVGYAVGTPRDPARRGGHVAVEHPEAARIARALKARGIVPDFRAPNVIRLAPVPLYTGFHDVWRAVRALREIVEGGEHLWGNGGRDLVA